MMIKSLETMEAIVKGNKSLSWDGWTVLSTKPAKNAVTSKDGVYINGKWHIQQRFEVSENGWNIPEKILESNG
jgi:hypothetical protein